MKKLFLKQKRIFIFTLMILFGSIFTVIFMALTGNGDQTYSDIVLEYMAVFSSNKSAERCLLFVLIFLGIILYGAFYLWDRSKYPDRDTLFNNNFEATDLMKTGAVFCVMTAVLGLYYLLFQEVISTITLALVLLLILYIIDKKLIISGICAYFCGIYAFAGLYRLYALVGGAKDMNVMSVAVLSLSATLIPLLFKNRKKAILRLCMIEGFFIPLTMLMFLANRYSYNGETVVINAPNPVIVFISLIIVVFMALAIIKLVKKWNKAESVDELITFGTLVSILVFNYYSGSGVIMTADLHHPFENIIGYSQIFALGQKPFSDYIPVSGMYSVIRGAIFDWFGGGTVANYYVTNNLFYLFADVLIVFFMRKHVKGSYALMLCLMYSNFNYDRPAFMLPIMLLLAVPGLIEKKRLWLQTWILTSLFNGLYYPLYGAAVCLAFAPLGIWQAVTYIKSGELKSEIKKVSFWITWGVSLGLPILCCGLLFGTLKHMLVMSGQSLMSDGIARFGQIVPDWFLPYLKNNCMFLRIAVYYILTVMVPVVFVWYAFAVAVKAADITVNKRRVRIKNLKIFCLLLCAVIMPIICYTFTFTRLDNMGVVDGAIYARSRGVLSVGVVMLLIFVWKYVDQKKLRILLMTVLTLILFIGRGAGVISFGSGSELAAQYTVPKEYKYIENDEIQKLGRGYINENTYNDIKNYYTAYKNKSRDDSYLGALPRFGYYYILGIKGDGTIETYTIKGYNSTKESIEIAKKNNTIIGTDVYFDAFNLYYLYHWLLCSNEYYWDPASKTFLPNKGTYSQNETVAKNKKFDKIPEESKLGKRPCSLGLSIKSLEKIFTEPDISCNISKADKGKKIDLGKSIEGNTMDFMYVEFEGMDKNYVYTLYDLTGEKVQNDPGIGHVLMKKKYNNGMTVRFEWKDDNGKTCAIVCDMSEGKLLIPLGAGRNWLLNKHNSITVKTYQDGKEIETPEIVNVRPLKLREIN